MTFCNQHSTRRVRYGVFALFAGLVLTAAMPLTGVAFDEVLIVGQPSQKGKITGLSPNEVKLNQTGIDRDFPVNTVAGVNFDQEPLELKAAKRFVLNQQINMAQAELAKLKEEDLINAAIAQEFHFYRAYCAAQDALAGNGSLESAYALMANFLTKEGGSKSFHYFEACEISGDLKAASGDYATAAKAYGIVARAPFPDFQQRAMVLQGRSLLRQKKYADALALFERVLGMPNAGAGSLEQKLYAQVGKAASLAATGKPDEGVKLIEKIIIDGDPANIKLFARANNALGACHKLAGRPKDALIAYLKTDLLFYGDGESHAEALFHLSQLWREVGRSDRGEKAKSTLQQRYPNSIFNNVN